MDQKKIQQRDRDDSVALKKASQGPYGRYVKQLLEIRDRLIDEIQFHAGDNLKLSQREAASDLSAYKFHIADAGTDNFDRDFALSMVSSEQEMLYEINAALKRLENGTYGICEMSGKPIPKERLDAIPWARFTKECQAEFEKKHPARRAQPARLFESAEEAAEEELGETLSETEEEG